MKPQGYATKCPFLTQKVDRVKIDGEGGMWVTMRFRFYRQACNCCAAHTGEERKIERRREKRQR